MDLVRDINLGSTEYLQYFPVAPSSQEIGHHTLPNVTFSKSTRAKHPIRLVFAISPNRHDATHYKFHVVRCFQPPQLENHQTAIYLVVLNCTLGWHCSTNGKENSFPMVFEVGAGSLM